MKERIYYFSGTHRDREWYQTYQGFRLMCVDFIDDMIDYLEKNPGFKVFHLDGQTIILQDYLEIMPENEQRLRRLIRDGRILIGPWYTMPDEFILSGESLIRNLRLGHRLSKEWGVSAWKNGYLCDIFGHISQMPQILSGFGIRTAVLGRGTNEAETPMFFEWKSPDGSS
ncbi:MAG: alpha-mannosidase, partial [Christensenellales bacterium]